MLNTSPSQLDPNPQAINSERAVLSTDLSVDYPQQQRVLDGACLEVFPGEVVGLVGESGSGKSTLALATMKLLDLTGARLRGRITLAGVDIMQSNERQMRAIRGRLVSLIPQSATAALNPALRIETQIREAWRAHSPQAWAMQKHRVAELLKASGLPVDHAFLRRFPREISVGQAQRLLIVMALLHIPPLLIADEPTSSLDLITQSDFLDLLQELRRIHNTAILFISHDLRMVAALCSRIAVLHQGRIVECESSKRLLNSPKHLYTQQLVAAVDKYR